VEVGVVLGMREQRGEQGKGGFGREPASRTGELAAHFRRRFLPSELEQHREKLGV
jgi:hypothetical protein